jgi:hypothetical protein
MNYVKELINNNLEQFKQNIESSLYAKLAKKLDEVKIDAASNVYNEGKCVPCMKKVNEGKKHDSYKDCVEFYMDAKDYSQEDARRECGHQKTAGNILDEE